jgi:hypothetical protein
VPRHLHGDALRDAGADKIADSSSTEVMQDAARVSGFGAGRPKGDPEAYASKQRAGRMPAMYL